MYILVLNCGSSSIKFKVCSMPDYKVYVEGAIGRVGYEDAEFSFKTSKGLKIKKTIPVKNHEFGIDLILKTLKDILEVFDDRNISISREITKRFEEHLRGTISEVIEKLNKGTVKGEFVVVIKGFEGEIEEKEEISIEEQLKVFLEEGYSKKEAVKLTSKKLNARRNEVYQKSLEI